MKTTRPMSMLVAVSIVIALGACSDSPDAPDVASRQAALAATTDVVAVEPDPGALAAFEVTPVAIPIPDDDQDRDGAPVWLDPDDHNPRVLPVEAGEPELDEDGDGVGRDADCDDEDESIGPFAHEVRCNGADENCDGHDDCDSDGDGVLDRDDVDPADAARSANETTANRLVN